MAKKKKQKVMQLDLYSDGSTRIYDAIQTKAAGKPRRAERTTWREFHKYLREIKERESVAEKQLTIIVTNPCCWIKIGNVWFRICW
jgi:hypothetical protein